MKGDDVIFARMSCKYIAQPGGEAWTLVEHVSTVTVAHIKVSPCIQTVIVAGGALRYRDGVVPSNKSSRG
jgi:hypothetical protein